MKWDPAGKFVVTLALLSILAGVLYGVGRLLWHLHA